VKGGPRRVETPHLALETRNVDRVPAARRRRGPESIPGQPPKRFGPSRTVATWSRVWPRSRSSRGISEETGCGGGYAFDRSRARLALSLNRSEERGSRAAPRVSRQRLAQVGALLWAAHEGPGVQRWPKPARCLGVTAEAGRVETCLGGHCRSRPGPGRSEISSASNKLKLSSSSRFQRRASRRSARLKARTRRGRRLCQSLPVLGKRSGQPATCDATV
jgi:hypothetical protein